MDKDWIVRALAMHAALVRYDVSDADLDESATIFAERIAAFADKALNTPVDPFK